MVSADRGIGRGGTTCLMDAAANVSVQTVGVPTPGTPPPTDALRVRVTRPPSANFMRSRTMRHFCIRSVAAAALAVFAACDSPSGEDTRLRPEDLRHAVLRGDGQRDTVRSSLADSLVVRVTDTGGQPVPNLTVGWTVLTEGGGAPLAATVQTDADGRARTVWTLGTRAGVHEMEVRAVLDGQPVILDTLRATARPGAAVTASVQGDTVRALGPLDAARVLLSGADQHGNAIAAGEVAAAWSSSAGAVAGVSENGTITAAAPGRATVTATGSGWTLRVHVTVTGMRLTIRSAPFVPFQIHGNGTRLLGTGDAVAVRRNGAWLPEPGLTPMVFLLGVRVLPSGEAWAVGAEPTQRVLWRSTAPGAWARVTVPDGHATDMIASAQGTVFISGRNGHVYRHDGGGWAGLGTLSGTGVRDIGSLAAASPTEVWAGGSIRDAFMDEASQPFLLRWTPGGWTRIAMPAGVALQQRSSVAVAARGDGGPVYAILGTAGSTTATYLLRVTGQAAAVVPLPASMAAEPVHRLGVGPDGPCITTWSRLACQRNGTWREHVLADGWMFRGNPFVDADGTVYVGISRRVNDADETAVAELEVF